MGQAQLVRGSVVCGALRMPEKGGEAVIQCRGDCELEGGRAGQSAHAHAGQVRER